MATTTDLIYDTKRKMLAKYPRFGSEIAGANIEYRSDLKYHTAATDGKNVFVDPGYFASLSEDERLFLIAHEIMHVKFMHMYRLEDKDGQKRDFDVWNTATDAIINANLERDGFVIKEGYVNRPEALNYTAEEFYEILMQEKEKEKEQKGQSGQNSDSKNGEGQNGNPEQSQGEGKQPEEMQGDDHSLWEEAFKNQQGDSQKSQKEGKEKDKKNESKAQKNEDEGESKKQKNDGSKDNSDLKEKSDSKVAEYGFEFDEKSEFEANRKEKRERFQANRKTQRDIRGVSEEKIELGDVGKSNDSIDWKLLVRREIDNSETIWSQRRSIAENNYAYRLEENDIEDEAETEVMIDVSGSVNLELVKAFLRELKPLVNESKLKVGCFNERFWGMVNINSERDIDKFIIPREARGQYAWTEDWDLAVRSFSKKREVNKFVFTDGYPAPGTMPKEDLKNENVIWLVYGNKNFRPCCGKVINISEKQLKKLSQVYEKNDDYER